MYDEGGEEQAFAQQGGGFKSKVKYHFEGLIPLILLVIVAVLAGAWIGLWDIPGLDFNKPAKMLIIGKPSQITLEALGVASKDLVRYTIRDTYYLGLTPEHMLSKYDMVMLDQTNSSFRPYISRQLGSALEEYVRKGGKLIIVGNSGILRSDAPEAIGWRANMGDISPVDCTADIRGVPSCLQPIKVNGTIYTLDYEHPIVEGIERVPAVPFEGTIPFEVYNVSVLGNEIAYIQEGTDMDVMRANWYPGIVERRHLLGKVVYFNYDPGLTRAILQNTIKYLK
ncbi:MAG: hypothetical protein N3F05_01980 [Candidatus Diapherotrites archaeon]|nr:hypothetical protein [Candidatus Diapherotrites archaeon]